MNSKLKFFIALIFVLLVRDAFMYAQVDQRILDLEKERKDYEQALGEIKPHILVNLSAQESSMSKLIYLKIVETGGDIQRCQALSPDEGRYPIEISQEFLRSLYMFIMANVIADQRGDRTQAYKYLDYVLRSLHAQNGSSGQIFVGKVESPEVQMHLSSAEREHVIQRSDELWTLNMMYVLSHEYAHHFLGHTAGTAARSKQVALSQEEQADEWATKHMLSLGIAPTAGLLSLAYFGALFEELGPSSEHPAGACRARAQLVATLQNFDSFSANLKARNVNLAAAKSELQQKLAGLDSSAGGCPPESDQSVKNLREMLAPLLGGGARARLCTMKGEIVGTDEVGRSYATPYKADGWETTLEFPRRETGCYLNAVRYGSDLGDAYDKVRDFIEAYSSSCKERESSRADAALYCPSIGAHAYLYIGNRHDRIVVNVDK